MNRYRKGGIFVLLNLCKIFRTINPTTHSITHYRIIMKINIFLSDFTHITIDAFFSD